MAPMQFDYTGTARLRMPGVRAGAAMAPTYLPDAAVAPLGAWAYSRLYAASAPASLIRAVNAGGTERDIGLVDAELNRADAFLATGGPFTTRTMYAQAGTGDLVPVAGAITTVTPNIAAGSRPALWLGTGGPASISYTDNKPLAIPATLSFDRADCTIFLVARTPGQGAATAYFAFGDTSVGTEFGLRSYATNSCLQPTVDGVLPTPTAVNNKTIGTCGDSVIVVHSNATRLRVYRDNEFVDYPPVSSKIMNRGGLLGCGFAVSGRSDIRAFEVFGTALSTADLAARLTAYKTKFGCLEPGLVSYYMAGDSLYFAAGAVNNRTPGAELAAMLPRTTHVRNAGISGHFLGGPNLANGHYQDWDGTKKSQAVFAGHRCWLVSDYGHNDIFQYIANQGQTAAYAVGQLQAAIRYYCAAGRATAGFDGIAWQEIVPDTDSGWTAAMEDARNQMNAWYATNPLDNNGLPCFNALDKCATDPTSPIGNVETSAGRGMTKGYSISADGTHPNETVAVARATRIRDAIAAAVPTPLAVTATVAPAATVVQNLAYPSFTVAGRYGVSPYTYALGSGWPAGTSIGASTGVVSGAVFPATGVVSGLTVRVTDSVGATRDYTVPDITVTAPVALFLDTLTARPDSSFAFRRLRSDYGGASMSLINASAATSELGFSGEVPDLTNLNGTFGGTSGTINVQAWYDQAGSANFVENTPANRPRVRTNGTNDTKTGTGTNPTPRMAMLMASTVGMTGAVSASTTQAILVVGSHNNASNGQITAPSANGGLSLRFNADHTLSLLKTGSGVLATSTVAAVLNQLTCIYVTLNPATGAYAFFIDGVSAGSGTIAAQTLTAGLSTTLGRATGISVSLSEIHFWSTVPGSDDQARIFANPRAYYRTV